MTREEAINKVRQMSLPKETMDILEALAPELTMSEDEMMIYELQGFLSSFGSDYFGTGEWQKFDDWLEKQKERVVDSSKTSADEDERIREAIESTIRVYGKTQGEWIGGYDMDTLVVHLREAFSTLEKQKEPLTAEEKMNHPLYLEGFDVGKKVGEVVSEQKPAEWSDEDADMLNCCISSIEEAKENRYAYKETDGDTSYDREIDWLNSLRPQLKQKWSEEDKKMLWIIQLALTKHPITDKQEKDAFDWLNSLRPQPHTVSIKNATKFGNPEYERGVKDGIQSEKSRQWKPSE